MANNEITIAQYFEQINERLDKIELGSIAQKTVLNFEEFCKYIGISKSHGYKLTSARAVPHFCPTGKALFFSKEQVDEWLLQNPIKTQKQLKREILGGSKL